MSDLDFVPLPGLTLVARLPGAANLARYADSTGACRVVERRPREGTPTDPALFQGNDLAGTVLHVDATHAHEEHVYLVYDDDAACALPARLHDRRWGEEERIACLSAIAAGIRELHARGLVHGDLTPDAVLLRADGSVRLSAIAPTAAPSSAMSAKPGEARTFGPTLNRIRATGGALAYLAPEQFMANTTLPASDVFAWGCIAYEVATGRSPFGFVTDPAKLLEAITRGPQHAVHEVSPRFTATFDAVVRATLAVERAKRIFPSDFSGVLVPLPADVALPRSPAATKQAPPWVLTAIVAAVACAGLAYFTLGR